MAWAAFLRSRLGRHSVSPQRGLLSLRCFPFRVPALQLFACAHVQPQFCPDDHRSNEVELAAGISRVKSAKTQGIRTGNWLSQRQAQALLSAPDISTLRGLRDRAILAVLLGCGLRRSEVGALTFAHRTRIRATVSGFLLQTKMSSQPE